MRREIEAERLLLARHPLAERPGFGGGKLEHRRQVDVAAEQSALPGRALVRRTVGAGEKRLGAGEGARPVAPDALQCPCPGPPPPLPPVQPLAAPTPRPTPQPPH